MAETEIKSINGRTLFDATSRQRIGELFDEFSEVSQELLETVSDLSQNKADKTDLTNPFNFKGSTTYSALPTTGNTINDTYYCTDLKRRYTWNGTAWYPSSLDESEYTDELNQLSEEIDDLQEGKSDVFFEKDCGNLYNYATDSEGNLAIDTNTGELYVQNGYRATDYIEVLPNKKTLYTNMNANGAFYDKDKIYICGKQFGVLQMDIPYNAKYYRGSVQNEKRTKSYVAYYDMTDNFKKYGEQSIEIIDPLFVECLYKYCMVSKKYTDKKIAIIGDSWSDPNNETCTKNWHDWIAEITGATVQCVAISGSGYKKGTDDENLYNTFQKQALLIDSDTDLVILFGSGNDCGTGSNFTFGSARDKTESTVGGCMNITLDNIQSTAPNARILMVSPAPWINFDPWWTSGTNGRMGVYTDLMCEVAKARGVRFKDMYRSSDMHPQNVAFKELYYNADGVHPNDNGQKRLYPDILAEVESILPITEVYSPIGNES